MIIKRFLHSLLDSLRMKSWDQWQQARTVFARASSSPLSPQWACCPWAAWKILSMQRKSTDPFRFHRGQLSERNVTNFIVITSGHGLSQQAAQWRGQWGASLQNQNHEDDTTPQYRRKKNTCFPSMVKRNFPGFRRSSLLVAFSRNSCMLSPQTDTARVTDSPFGKTSALLCKPENAHWQ